MANLDGIDYENLVVGKHMGRYRCNASKELIMDYIKNTGLDYRKFLLDSCLIAPAAMAFIFTLRTIFANRIPIGGAILAGQDLECIEPIREGHNICVDVIIKDKYIRKERKYVLLDFVISGDDGNVNIINTMRAIWPQ